MREIQNTIHLNKINSLIHIRKHMLQFCAKYLQDMLDMKYGMVARGAAAPNNFQKISETQTLNLCLMIESLDVLSNSSKGIRNWSTIYG